VLGDFIKNFGSGIQQVLQQFRPSIDAFKGAFDALGQTLEKTIGNYGPRLVQNFQAVGNAAAGLANLVLTGLGNSLTVIIKYFDQIINSPIVVFLSGQVAKAIGEILNGVGALANEAAKLSGGFGQGFIAFLDATEKLRAGLEPILILAKEIGPGIIESLAPVTPALQPLIAGFEGLKAVIGPIDALFSKAFRGIGDFAKNAFKSALDSVDGFATRVKDSVRAIIDNPAFQAVARVLKINISDIKAQLDSLDARAAQTKEAAKITKQGVAQEGKKGDDNVTFQQFQVDQLGNSYEQLKKKADSALRTIQSGGDKNQAQQFQKSASDLVKLTQQQVELGQITQEEAEKRLKALAGNSRVEVETQQSALKTIVDLRKSALDRQVKDIDAQTANIANAVKRGTLTELQGAEQTTKLKQQQFQLQLADTRKAIEAEEKAISGGTGSATRLNALKAQQKNLNEGLEKEQIEGAERIQKARFDSIQKA
jgi:hypothetical protein